MTDVNFLILTAVAAVAFAFALLGVMTQWLKADEQSNALEATVQSKLHESDALSGPMMSVSSSAAPHAAPAPAEQAANAQTKAVVLDTTEADELESYIARHLFAWGGAATVLGMIVGWFVASFAGALIGATIGTVLGVSAGTAAAALKRRQR